MLEKGRLNPATNLQYGVTVAAEDDVFLAATDGVWDTLDPVQANSLHRWPPLSRNELLRSLYREVEHGQGKQLPG